MASDLLAPTARFEVLLGRLLALCVHPYAAWRTSSTAGRLLVLFTYLAASYAVMLTLLFISAS